MASFLFIMTTVSHSFGGGDKGQLESEQKDRIQASNTTTPAFKLSLGFNDSSRDQFWYFKTTSPFGASFRTKQWGLVMLCNSIFAGRNHSLTSNITSINSTWGEGVYACLIAFINSTMRRLRKYVNFQPTLLG